MPLSIFSTVRPTFQGPDSAITINQVFVGKYCYVELTGDVTWTLANSLITTPNAEIDIRNDADSLGIISIEAFVEPNGAVINVSGDLGLDIPAGGIGELKRRGSSNVYDFYGYVE